VNKTLNHPKIFNIILPLIGGILYAAGFPMGEFKGLIITPIIGLVLFFLCIDIPHSGDLKEEARPLGSELIALLFFSIGYCLMGYYWIPYTLKEFGQIPFPFNQVMGLLFSLIITPQFLLFVLIKKGISKFRFKSHSSLQSRTNRHLLFALFLTVLEYYTPQQFPAHLGHPWLTIAPYIGLAPIVGAPLFSFMSFWLVLAIVEYIKTRTLDKLAFISFAIFMVVNISLPLKREIPTSSNNIRLVQANIGNFMKIQSEKGSLSFMQDVYSKYYNLSTKPSEAPLDLIIWPETAYPNLLNSELMKTHPSSIPSIFKNIVREMNSELFVGGYDRNTKAKSRHFQSEYNTTFHFSEGEKLKAVYHKMKLIPFGEGLPFGPLNEFLSGFITNVSYFAAGSDYSFFKTKNGTPFITHICYEILFSWFTRDYLNSLETQPEFIINLTNDSWYGDTSEPYQHLYLAHWRALEYQIPIVRMTNTGISSILFEDGSESKRSAIGVEEVMDFKLETSKRNPTPFQRFGFLITVLIWFLFTLIGLILKKRTN
tara:strand:+ start:44570 stop:46189 length:1620 start_codon:yes stop_codon:yes gene_type:complete